MSMLRLPVGDNMRCRLLLGLAVNVASYSKPTVALIRSRRITRAISGSPLRNRVAASSSSACANAGSLSTRSTTVLFGVVMGLVLVPGRGASDERRLVDHVLPVGYFQIAAEALPCHGPRVGEEAAALQLRRVARRVEKLWQPGRAFLLVATEVAIARLPQRPVTVCCASRLQLDCVDESWVTTFLPDSGRLGQLAQGSES